MNFPHHHRIVAADPRSYRDLPLRLAEYGTDKINGKIQRAEQAKVHTMLVIGLRDMAAGNVSVRLHDKGNVGAKPKAEVIADILQAIKERRS